MSSSALDISGAYRSPKPTENMAMAITMATTETLMNTPATARDSASRHSASVTACLESSRLLTRPDMAAVEAPRM